MASLKRSPKKIAKSLAGGLIDLDCFTVSKALAELAELGDVDLAGRAWGSAWERVVRIQLDFFDGKDPTAEEQEGEFSVDRRLGEDCPMLLEMARMAVKMAAPHGAVPALKSQAMDMASCLEGGGRHLTELVKDLRHFHVDAGQRQMIGSLLLARALAEAGCGFDKFEMRGFAWKFKEWLHPENAALTDEGAILFMGHEEAFESAFFEGDDGEEPFMASLRASLRAGDLERSVSERPRAASKPAGL